jgi:hypothetical protein
MVNGKRSIMKLVNYQCNVCSKDYEEFFNDSEEQPRSLDYPCECGGELVVFNYKRNCHRVYIEDTGGLD